jgi:hypothetical protein
MQSTTVQQGALHARNLTTYHRYSSARSGLVLIDGFYSQNGTGP